MTKTLGALRVRQYAFKLSPLNFNGRNGSKQEQLFYIICERFTNMQILILLISDQWYNVEKDGGSYEIRDEEA